MQSAAGVKERAGSPRFVFKDVENGMAISRVEYALILKAREAGIFKLGGSLIEFGEANWYGDFSVGQLREDIGTFAAPSDAPALRLELERVVAARSKIMHFEIARIFYKCFLQNAAHVAVDFSGTATALRLDLNEPLAGVGQHDVFLDFGTAEHVFDVRQFFANAHHVTHPGGVMIHGLPWVGWVDHGFYNFQPTLYFDLAAANDYRIRTICYGAHDPFELISLSTRESVVEFAKAH